MLELTDVSVSYGQRRVLNGVNLGVRAGEVVALVGPNGAGKSTLIRAVSGVVPLQSGEVRVNGEGVLRGCQRRGERATWRWCRRRATCRPASRCTRRCCLGAPHTLAGSVGPARATTGACNTRWNRPNCSRLAERYVGELSGGEQQRVLLARALAQDTPVLLLDEPTTHLDLQHREGLMRTIRSLALHKNLAILMVLHDLNAAALYAHRVALLVAGNLEAQGTATEVLTEKRLSQVYQMPVRVLSHPEYGTPLVVPDGLE